MTEISDDFRSEFSGFAPQCFCTGHVDSELITGCDDREGVAGLWGGAVFLCHHLARISTDRGICPRGYVAPDLDEPTE